MSGKKIAKRPTQVNLDQEAVLRQLVAGAEAVDLVLPRDTMRWIYDMLGYKVAPNGARVNANKEITFKFGEPCTVEDEFYADWQDITDAEIADNSGASEQAEGSPVGEGVLREEV